MITAASKSYMKLIAQFPLRPIRNDKHLDAAHEMMTRLAVRKESLLDEGERDYLDVLSNLIEAYDEKHHPMPTSKSTPAENLRNLVDQAGVTPAELEKILDLSQAAISLILSGKRGLSKTSIAKLTTYFKVQAEYFMGE